MAGYKPDRSHTTTLEATPTDASKARAFVTHHFVDHRLPYLVDPLCLVASESATNALVHAQTAFSVTLSASDTRVLLTVRDHSLTLPERRAPSPWMKRASDWRLWTSCSSGIGTWRHHRVAHPHHIA